jgi:ferric-dicitrate binding protein FerR (iron transport regulator)
MARVERISGQVQVFSQQSTGEGAALAMQMPVYLGQTLQTGSDSGISLRLGGISLRVDQESRLTLADENTVALEHGRLYVDTRGPGPLDAVAARDLQIRTDLGLVSHLGTQYLVQRRDDWLRVGVRDGGVRVDDPDPGVVATLLVPTGQELQLDDSGAQEITPLSSYGPDWQWAENLAPDFVLDGRTMAQFLDWVASETGLEIAYQSDRVRSVAEETMLHGKVDLPAKAALQLVLKTSDLSAEIRDGVIEISLKS